MQSLGKQAQLHAKLRGERGQPRIPRGFGDAPQRGRIGRGSGFQNGNRKGSYRGDGKERELESRFQELPGVEGQVDDGRGSEQVEKASAAVKVARHHIKSEAACSP